MTHGAMSLYFKSGVSPREYLQEWAKEKTEIFQEL